MEEKIKEEFLKSGFTLDEEEEILKKCTCFFFFFFFLSNFTSIPLSLTFIFE